MNITFKVKVIFPGLFSFLCLIHFSVAQGEVIDETSFQYQIELRESTLQGELDDSKFDSIVNVLSAYGDIHKYMINNIERCGRDPIFHNPVTTYFSHIIRNMDSIYTGLIINKLRAEEIHLGTGIPLVFHLQLLDDDKCRLYNELKWEEMFREKKYQTYLDQLLDFKEKLRCDQ